ncbi:MAG: CRISPR-associated ring nuclease Csm6 [Succinivibrionaceae bacterium]
MKKDILLSVIGLSPQVITETLYGIYKSEPDHFPSEIYIITTQIGAQKIEKDLIDSGILKDFFNEYELPPIKQDNIHIKIIADSKGNAIDDARNKEEQEVIADFIYKEVKSLTDAIDKDGNVKYRIHASLAGGRKTMTYLLGSVMSLLGNHEDKLSHVLVSEGYESTSFYYPSKKSKIIQAMINKQIVELDLKDAIVELSEIPFIRLRTILQNTDNFLSTYNDAVNKINYALSLKKENLILGLNSDLCQLNINNEYTVKLSPLNFAFYRMNLENLKRKETYIKPSKNINSISSNYQYIANMYKTIFEFTPIVNPNIKKKLICRINEIFEENSEIKRCKNEDFLVDIVDLANKLYADDLLEREKHVVTIECCSSDDRPKSYEVQHPYSQKELGKLGRNPKFVDSQIQYWKNRIREINATIRKEVSCKELADFYTISSNIDVKINILAENIIVDDVPFTELG